MWIREVINSVAQVKYRRMCDVVAEGQPKTGYLCKIKSGYRGLL